MGDISRTDVTAHAVGQDEQQAFMRARTQVEHGKIIFLPLTVANRLARSELLCKFAHNAWFPADLVSGSIVSNIGTIHYRGLRSSRIFGRRYRLPTA
jgi:hypothetical protein